MTALLESLPVVGSMVVAYLYLRAYRRCHLARAGPVTTSRLAGFLLGAALVMTALYSPLDAAADRRLAAHMAQHVLLLVAPLPLLAAHTGTAVLLGIDPPLRSRLSSLLRRIEHRFRVLWSRPIAWALLVATLALWHLPSAFQAAAVSPLLHTFEHVSFLAAAGVWWLSLVGSGPRRSRSYGSSLLSVFGTMMLGTAVGALLTFSVRPWYPLYAARVESAGGEWLADQQLAGLVMWIPPGAILLAVFIWLAAEWLRSVDSRVGNLTT